MPATSEKSAAAKPKSVLKAAPARRGTAAEREFRRVVNMTAEELDRWLRTKDSKSVGWVHEGETEAVGHHSGRHILKILRAGPDGDDRFVHKVIGYVHRHLAQRPEGDISATRWRHSLMNWGHDPLKTRRRAA